MALKTRVAAALIAGDGAPERELLACFKSLQDNGVAAIFVAYNGAGKFPIRKVTKGIKIPVIVENFEWENDFSVARQQSFDMIPKDQFDWIMWIDSDDLFHFEEGENFDTLVESLDEYSKGVYLRYDYAVEPETDVVVVVQWRERLLSTDVDWKWKWPIHEVCQGPPGTQYAQRKQAWLEHTRKSGDDRGARERNRKIIAGAIKEEPNEPRYHFYFAGEAMAEADSLSPGPERNAVADAAILSYQRFLQMSSIQTDDLYLAATRIGDLHMMKGDPNSAINAWLEAIKIYPDWPDAYIGIAKACLEIGDYPRMKAFANVATMLPRPVTPASVESLNYGWTQHLLRGIASEEMGEFSNALDDYLYCLEIHDPPNGTLRDRIAHVKEIIESQGETDEDHWSLRKSLRGTKKDKSIAFVTNPLPEHWHPELEKEFGAGGAETCIMRLAPRFAADGWRVAVFGTPGPVHRGVDSDGVEWWNSDEFLPNEEFSVLVGSRTPQIFRGDLAARKSLLWMHDVNVGPPLLEVADRPDLVVGLTMWHAQHMAKLYGIPADKLAVIPNGIEQDLYNEKEETWLNINEPRFIWSSSPDRGLDTVLSLWPLIQNDYPNARLDIFYGWNIIDKIIQSNSQHSAGLEAFKTQILGNIEWLGGEEGGIYQHGRVPQSELAKWQMSADFWPYPTDFMETFCITAVEMQAAGVIPITSDLAGLSETVALPWLRVDGWPKNSDYQTRWLRVLTSLLEDTKPAQLLRDQARRQGRKHAENFTWDKAYTAWNDVFALLEER